ncbi:MAG: ThuA domain-containing protein [Oscillospiraceae bacterium]|jgi:type 1 glutamine amidotransferase|nr:ThuA domain-containing protein [Oscillospiraceae bacterium]
MRVLLLCDDYWHPGQVPIDGVGPLKAEGFQFDIITDAKEFSTDMLRDYPAVLLSKCDETSAADGTPWKTEEVQRAFIGYVEGGGGLLAVHTALVAGKQTEALDRLIGSRFTFHPNGTPVLVQPLKPHPVTDGVGAFTEPDEQYRLEILASDIDVLTASYAPGQGDEEKYITEPYHNAPAWLCPACYVRTQGKGRVCVLTPGHHLAVWHNPEYQKTLRNALQWVSNAP